MTMSCFNKEQVQDAVALGRMISGEYAKWVVPAAVECDLSPSEQLYMAIALAYHHNYVLDAQNGELVYFTAPKYMGELKLRPLVFRGPDGKYPDDRPRTITIFYEDANRAERR